MEEREGWREDREEWVGDEGFPLLCVFYVGSADVHKDATRHDMARRVRLGT